MIFAIISSEILFFNQNDYSVFAYDYSGCFDSEGKLGGFYQSLIDLNNSWKPS